jgi:UDP-N-acetylmuramate--alanine ligase
MNTPFRGLDHIREVYFIGIGGIGMSAIARFFHAKNVLVSGYDKTPTVLTRELEKSGIKIHYDEDLELIPANPDFIVYTPAVPATHKELVHYQQQGKKVLKRSDVLQIISEGSFNICVAGTHGKTTITTMIAHLLRDTGFGCNAFLGGISVNYETNFWSNPRNVCVIEADEYDRSFLKLSPDVAVVTAMDADHLDIYGTPASVQDAFIDFSRRVKSGGLLVKNKKLERGSELNADHTTTYSLDDDTSDSFASNIRMLNGSYEFDATIKGKVISDVRLNMGGLHNIENVIAAITVASSLDIDSELIKQAVAGFRGVKRRFEYMLKTEDTVFIDDYAHHPEELRALLTGARGLFPEKKCTIIFQPHLFSRTRDFADEFAESLSIADEVILLPIYPARELPIEGVSSEMIAARISGGKARVVAKENLLRDMDSKQELLITAGAGDIDTLLELIRLHVSDEKN